MSYEPGKVTQENIDNNINNINNSLNNDNNEPPIEPFEGFSGVSGITEVDPSKLTTKDLIYIYLREVDILQKHLELLEKRLSDDIKRIDDDSRSHNVSNEKDFRELRDNCKTIIDEINLVHICISKIKDNIHVLELQKVSCDLTQNNRIDNLEVKVAFYSIIGGILTFLGIDNLEGLITFITKLIT